MTTIVLPWPPKELFPNRANRRQGHWAYAKRARALRTLAWGLTANAIGPKLLRKYPDGEVVLQVEIMPPMRPGSPPDEDGVMAALKPARDGLADALGINDKHFRQAQPVWLPRGGEGKITISW